MPHALLPTPAQSRRAVGALFFLSGLCFASWASRIPDIRLQLHLSEGRLGQLLLAMPVGSLVALPLAGWLVDTYGSRIVVLLSATLYAVALPVLGWAPSVWTLAGALLVFGFAGDLVNIAINTQALEVQDQYPHRSIVGVFHGLWSLAGFTGGLIATALVGAHQPPLRHFLGIAVGLLVVVAVARSGLPRPSGGHAAGTGLVLRLPDRQLLGLGLMALFGLLCEGAMFDWSGVYFQRAVHADKAWVTAGYVAFMGAMATGRFGTDWLATRFGTRAVLRGSSALLVVGLLTAVAWPTFWAALGGFLLVGFGTSSVIPLTYAATGRVGTLSPGVALAFVSTVGFFGFLVGPPLIGLLAEWGSLRLSFAVIAGCGAVVGLLATAVPDRRDAPEATPLPPAS